MVINNFLNFPSCKILGIRLEMRLLTQAAWIESGTHSRVQLPGCNVGCMCLCYAMMFVSCLYIGKTGQGTYVRSGHQHGRWRHGTRARVSASATQRLLSQNSNVTSSDARYNLSNIQRRCLLRCHFHIRTADVYHRLGVRVRAGTWQHSSTCSSGSPCPIHSF